MSIRSSKKFVVAAALAMSAVAASTASAALIEFSYSGNASGTWLSGIYSGQSFTARPFTITASSLTESITPFGSAAIAAPHDAAFVSIAGFGLYSVTSQTATFVNNSAGRAGLTVVGQGDVVSFGNSAFSTWDMQTSVGPVTGTGVFNTQTIFTTIGALRFTGSAPVTFSANVVPAPGAIALLGLAGLAGRRRR
jgi:hypothetical protein